MPRVATVVPLVAILWLTGHFERVREFIRKPYIIGQYMYANGLRVEDYALLQRDGVLAYATYSNPLIEAEKRFVPASLPEADRTAALARLQKGKDVFMDTCSRCHTTHGVNGVAGHLQRMFGDARWTPDLTADYVANMHNAQPYMPPFPGSKDELGFLATYLEQLQGNPSPVPGAQQAGVAIRPAGEAKLADDAASGPVTPTQGARK